MRKLTFLKNSIIFSSLTVLTLFFVGLFFQYKNKPKLNVVLILVDTLRADHLGAYGYPKPTSPRLDQFAKKATLFENAISPAPFTMPAMASLFTGLYPDRAGVVDHSSKDALDTPVLTMAEKLKESGYQTAAVVSNRWLEKLEMKFNRGFDHFLTSDHIAPGKRLTAPIITEASIHLLKKIKDRPFFLWAHYFDPHMPYNPPVKFSQPFGNEDGFSQICYDFNRARKPQDIFFSKNLLSKELESTRQLYDGAIRYVDSEIGRLLDFLSQNQLLENTIVVILSDHGESLGEHGLSFSHAFTLYEELLHVPLIIWRPGFPSNRIKTPVSLVDIYPSLFKWLKISPSGVTDGKPLEMEEASMNPNRGIFAASIPWTDEYNENPYQLKKGLGGRWTMIRSGNDKLIKIPGQEKDFFELYNLKTDPNELKKQKNKQIFDQLLPLLAQWEEEMLGSRENYGEEKLKFSPTELEEFRALGYLH